MIRIRGLGIVATLAAMSAIAPNALAAPCAGFNDVESTSPFCPSVEWIKNRGVTVGCTATEYCPDLPTTRLAMAAFMTRLGDRLSPTIVSAVANGGTFNLDIPNPSPSTRDPSSLVCITTPFSVETTPTNYPRTAVLKADFSGSAGGPVQVFGIPAVSTDGGTTFTDVLTYGMRMSVGPLAPGWTQAWQSMAQNATLPLVPGTTYIFGYLVQRSAQDVGGTNDLAQWRCSITLSIYNAKS